MCWWCCPPGLLCRLRLLLPLRVRVCSPARDWPRCSSWCEFRVLLLRFCPKAEVWLRPSAAMPNQRLLVTCNPAQQHVGSAGCLVSVCGRVWAPACRVCCRVFLLCLACLCEPRSLLVPTPSVCVCACECLSQAVDAELHSCRLVLCGGVPCLVPVCSVACVACFCSQGMLLNLSGALPPTGQILLPASSFCTTAGAAGHSRCHPSTPS